MRVSTRLTANPTRRYDAFDYNDKLRPMDALQKVIRKIHADPVHPASAAFKSLVESLDQGLQFDISRLYLLGYNDFGLALELMREWRLDSYRYERGWATRAASALDATTQPPDWARIGRAAAHLS